MNNSYISELLATDGYIQVNKKLIKTLGLHEAIIIGELCSEYNYWKIKGDLVEDSFYSTRDNIEENTGLSEHYQRKAIENLIAAEIVSVVKRGIPAKNYYRIDFDKLLTLLTTSCQSRRQLDVDPVDLNNKETNINKKDITIINNSNTDDFFGKIKNKKKSLYEKCYDHILEFTNNVGLIEALTEYLKIRLQMKEKPLYEGTWKGMLNKLAKMDNQIEVVNTSIERGWASFFEQKLYNKKGKEVFGEDDNVQSVKGEFESSGETF